MWAKSPPSSTLATHSCQAACSRDRTTGAAAAAFGGYRERFTWVDLPACVTVVQGEDMGRPSRLDIDLIADDDRVESPAPAAPIPACGR